MGALQNKAYDIQLNPFDAYIPGNVNAQIQKQKRTIPADRNYQFFIMQLLNCVPADLNMIQLTANGLQIQTWQSGMDLDLYNQIHGLAPANFNFANDGAYYLVLSTRRDRLLGGALQALSNGVLFSGVAKDLETNTSLNCASPDGKGFQIETVSLEVWLTAPNNANKPVINLYAYGYDPFPGGPGSMKFVDQKLVNVPAGQFTFDKDTAFTLGDGMRQFMDQVIIMNPNNDAIDNLVVNWQTLPVRNRLAAVQSLIRLDSLTQQNIAGIFPLYDSREMAYGDETLPIGLLNSAFNIKATFPNARGFQLYQVSQGVLSGVTATTAPVGQA